VFTVNATQGPYTRNCSLSAPAISTTQQIVTIAACRNRDGSYDNNNTVYCLTKDGNVLWQVPLRSGRTILESSVPAQVDGSNTYLAKTQADADGSLTHTAWAWRLSDGKQVWKATLSNNIKTSIVSATLNTALHQVRVKYHGRRGQR
jgi:outer membrane protein assembly factor BamB